MNKIIDHDEMIKFMLR